jgi:diketogulonate reductase-like aldo/keto reductase
MNSLNKIENYVRVSLTNLGVSYLDLYLMHWPDSSAFGDATDPPSKSGSEHRQFLNRLKQAWKAMEALVDLGLVRAIGVSNFSVQQIKELLKFAKVVPAVNQVGSSFLLASAIHFEQIFITGCSFIDLDKCVPPPFQ